MLLKIVKKKLNGAKINEIVFVSKNVPTMSKIYLELEKAKKEREDIAKELKKVENEAQVVEMGKKILFLIYTSSLNTN